MSDNHPHKFTFSCSLNFRPFTLSFLHSSLKDYNSSIIKYKAGSFIAVALSAQFLKFLKVHNYITTNRS